MWKWLIHDDMTNPVFELIVLKAKEWSELFSPVVKYPPPGPKVVYELFLLLILFHEMIKMINLTFLFANCAFGFPVQI